MKKKKATFASLVGVMHRLRAPGGCPWDARQTHASLLKYLREEALEVRDAVKRRDWTNLEEELGDLLLQVLFHAELASERGDFDIHDVVAGLEAKLIRRHPHVFGAKRGMTLSLEDLNRQWKEIKAREKARKKRRR